MPNLLLLDLLGGVALLLWGLHMIQSGILRAFGPELRRILSKAFGNRFAAFATGLGSVMKRSRVWCRSWLRRSQSVFLGATMYSGSLSLS